jgi:hypothetical protein
VFLIGLVKLWHNNRQVHKYELMDEERRTRLAEMKHCGIRHLAYSGVPFGVRAIEQGVEVEGIWVASGRPKETSHVVASSSATLAVDASDRASPEETTVHGSGDDGRRSKGKSTSSTFTGSPASSSRANHPTPAASSETGGGARRISTPTEDTENRRLHPNTQSLQGSERSFILSAQQMAWHRPRSRAVSLDSSTGSNLQNARQVYGSAQAFANRTHRRLNSGFEVLPAGTFGVMPEFPFTRPGNLAEEQGIELQPRPGPAKLQKQKR